VSARVESDRLRVVLVATRNPLNIGAAARAMSNFGFLHLRVVNPYEPSFREARSAVGASQVLQDAEQFDSVAGAVADCALVVGTTSVGSRELQHPVRSLDQAGPFLRKRLASTRIALLFGSEKVGLSNEDLSHCHWLLRVPTRQEHRSLNLAQAVAICLYQLSRGGKMATPATRSGATRGKKVAAASASELERIGALLLDALSASDYFPSAAPGHREEKLRRLIRRLEFSASDAEIWLGMLRKIVWKLEHGGKAAD
jgi:TrmH family RNA methyltransferase